MLRDLALKEPNGMTNELDLLELGKIANDIASQNAFNDYQNRKATNTTRRQKSELDLFAVFLRSRGVEVGDLFADPQSWEGVTWGLVAAYQAWLLSQGYAVSGINGKVSTVKIYAKLAFKAGTLGPTEYALISALEGYSRQEQTQIDKKRLDAGLKIRIGRKKETPTVINGLAARLKDQPDTPIGRRDRLIMCILLDHGLRVSEVSVLEVQNFDLHAGTFTFSRPKTGTKSTHKMSPDTLAAALAYLGRDADTSGPLLKGKNRGGYLTKSFKLRAVTKRVRELGQEVGLNNLSPHDCRHYAATKYAKTMTLKELMDFFGWSSPAMPMRYIRSAEVSEPK